MNFLDTSVFVCAASKFDNRYNISHGLSKGAWVTTEHVVDELTAINQRRNSIYKNVIRFSSREPTNLKITDLHNRVFKASLVGNHSKNDASYVETLFKECLRLTGYNEQEKLTEEIVLNFKSVLYPLIRHARIVLGFFLHNFEDSTFYRSHVIENDVLKHYKKIKKEFYNKIPDYQKHKNDIKIISSVFSHSVEKKVSGDFCTLDYFFRDFWTTMNSIMSNNLRLAHTINLNLIPYDSS